MSSLNIVLTLWVFHLAAPLAFIAVPPGLLAWAAQRVSRRQGFQLTLTHRINLRVTPPDHDQHKVLVDSRPPPFFIRFQSCTLLVLGVRQPPPVVIDKPGKRRRSRGQASVEPPAFVAEWSSSSSSRARQRGWPRAPPPPSSPQRQRGPPSPCQDWPKEEEQGWHRRHARHDGHEQEEQYLLVGACFCAGDDCEHDHHVREEGPLACLSRQPRQ